MKKKHENATQICGDTVSNVNFFNFCGVDLFESNYTYYYRANGQCIQREWFAHTNS